MGMFDTVVIEGLKLPKPPKEIDKYLKLNNKDNIIDFQTKDLENYLGVYRIRSNGQVYEEIHKPTGKKVPYEPFYLKWEDNRAFLEKLYYKFKYSSANDKTPKFTQHVKKVLRKANITATISIYGSEEINGRYVDLEYNVVISKGKVSKITLVKAELESEQHSIKRIKERQEFDKNLQASFDSRREFISKWYYPILKEIYNPFILFSRLFVQWICNKALKATYRWHGI